VKEAEMETFIIAFIGAIVFLSLYKLFEYKEFGEVLGGLGCGFLIIVIVILILVAFGG